MLLMPVSQPEVFVILPDIRSVHNVGSIFRTSDAAGVAKIYLIGQTPAPVNRFGLARKDFAKVSLGAEKMVPWQYQKSAVSVIRSLKKKGVKIVAVEQTPDSIDYKTFQITSPTAFIFGNEVDGLSKNLLRHSDQIVEIPMLGQKESLNVSVSAGIILFNIARR